VDCSFTLANLLFVSVQQLGPDVMVIILYPILSPFLFVSSSNFPFFLSIFFLILFSPVFQFDFMCAYFPFLSFQESRFYAADS